MSPDLDLVVGTSDLRAALSSVMVHACTRPANIDHHQVHIAVGPENMTLTAVDGMSAGLAIVSVHSNNSGVLGAFALLPGDASKIMTIFKAGAEKGDEPQQILQLVLDDEDHLTITDQSGMMPGRSLRIPIIPKEDTENERRLDVTKLIAGMHYADPAMLAGVSFPGVTLARFRIAAAAYRSPVQIGAIARGRSLLVRCGDSFLGALMPASLGEGEESDRERWISDWSERLPRPTFTIVKNGETP